MNVHNKPVRFYVWKFCHLESMKLMKSNNFTKKKKKATSDDSHEAPVAGRICLFVSLCFIMFLLFTICVFSENQFQRVNIKTNKQKKYIILKSVLCFECRFLYLIIWNMDILKCLLFFFFSFLFIFRKSRTFQLKVLLNLMENFVDLLLWAQHHLNSSYFTVELKKKELLCRKHWR